MTFGNIKPERNREPRVLYENDPSSLISLYNISPRERLVKAPRCRMHERTSESRPRPTPAETKTRPTSPEEATFIIGHRSWSQQDSSKKAISVYTSCIWRRTLVPIISRIGKSTEKRAFRPNLRLRSGQGISSPDVVSRLGRNYAPADTHTEHSSNSRRCGSPLGHLASSSRLTLAHLDRHGQYL